MTGEDKELAAVMSSLPKGKARQAIKAMSMGSVGYSAMEYAQAVAKVDWEKIDRKEKLPVDISHGRGSVLYRT